MCMSGLLSASTWESLARHAWSMSLWVVRITQQANQGGGFRMGVCIAEGVVVVGHRGGARDEMQ